MDIREELIDVLLQTDLIAGYDWVGTGSSSPSEDQIRGEVGEVADKILAHFEADTENRIFYRADFRHSGMRAGFGTHDALQRDVEMIADTSVTVKRKESRAVLYGPWEKVED